MNKAQFLDAVRQRLAGLPQTDADRFLDYCREMIDDRMEEGLSEEEAVAVLGSPEYVAAQLLMDTPPQRLDPPKSPVRELKTWQVVVLALTCPVWIPVLFAAVITSISLVISAVATIFGLYCAGGGLIIGGTALIVLGPTQVVMPDLLFLLAAGALLTGIGLLMILGMNYIWRQVIRLCKWLVQKTRSLLPRKEA